MGANGGRAETSHSDEVFDAWEADSWRLPPGVTGVFSGPTGVRLGIRDGDGQLWHGVDGRRAPVVGRIRRLDDGERVIVPVNRGARRADDRALLDSVADLFEMRAAIPRSGRRRDGLADRACRWIAAQEALGTPRASAIEKAADVIGWGTDSLDRSYRRWRRDRFGYQRRVDPGAIC